MKTHLRFLSCIVLPIAFLIPSVTAQTPTPGLSGIEGLIMVSPSHPGPIRKDRPNAKPAGNVKFVVKTTDAQIASFTTDAEGRFHVSLPPGHYTVTREDPGARIGRWRWEADVKSGEVTKVQWTADSGMR